MAVAAGPPGRFAPGDGPTPSDASVLAWLHPFSAPLHAKGGIPAAANQFLAFNPLPIVSIPWFESLSEPVRIKPGLRPSLQSVLAYHPFPVIDISWFAGLSEPVRLKPGLRTGLQQFFAADTDVIPISKLIQWFGNLSEPVRIRPGLKASLQQFLASPSRLLPTPTSFGVLDALETKDTFLAGAMVWNRATDAEIGVINTTPQPAEIAIYPAGTPAGVITCRISISLN